MNYIEQVAKMLGVELNEEFYISFNQGTKYKFTECGGLEYFNKTIGKWMVSTGLFNILNGAYEIVKPILDKEEKEYLSNIIKPWRNSVKSISKCGLSNCEYLTIAYYDKLTEKEYEMYFPAFEKGTMYKGMETNKEYTLEELGL